MDLDVKVESNWNSSHPLQTLLHTSDNECCDQAVAEDAHVVLTKPDIITSTSATDQNSTCCITLRCSGLSTTGYCLERLLLTSGARSAEYYVGRANEEVEYINTSRGSFIKLSDSDRERYSRLYCCTLHLSHGLHNAATIVIKLPSLKGSSQVVVTKILMLVSNSTSSTDGVESSNHNHSANGHQFPTQVANVFAELQSSCNVPPYMSTLLTALKTSSITSDNVGDLTAMFREMRKPDITPLTQEDDSPKVMPTQASEVVETSPIAEDEDNTLEFRMKQYIDHKFLEFKVHLDTQLQLLKQSISDEIGKMKEK